MKTITKIMAMTMIAATVFTSCNQDDDDDDNTNTLPDLTASLSVTGAVIADYNFMNPENGGSNATHSMIASHSSVINAFSITGLNTAYTYSVSADMQGVQTGTYTITAGNYGHLESQPALGFPEVVDGTINITSAQLLWTVGGTSVYSISGNWNVNLSDGETPPSTVTFSGTFTNLAVTAS